MGSACLQGECVMDVKIGIGCRDTGSVKFEMICVLVV